MRPAAPSRYASHYSMSGPNAASSSGCSYRAALLWGALVLIGGAASAQTLDEDCFVTVNGQTVVPNADGTFTVQGVPAGTGLIRVEVICNRFGITFYGASDFFALQADETFDVESLAFSGLPLPLLESILAVPQNRTLANVGETTQIEVTGFFADGTSRPVADAILGSGYTSSNPAVVTVDADGLVTATGPGAATITVNNQGAASTATVAVSFAPPTTIEGFVQLEDGTPIANATVTLLDLGGSELTDSSGFFCIGCVGGPVASDLGTFNILVDAIVAGQSHAALASDIQPVPDRITDAGVIELRTDGIHWTSAADGEWTDATRWHTGTVPTSAEDGFLTRSGDYRVRLTGPSQGSVRSLEIGNPQAELLLLNTTLTSASDVINSGTVALEASSNFAGATLASTQGSIIIETSGALEVRAAGGGARTISANTHNAGRLEVNRSTTFSEGFAHVNRGDWIVQNGTASFRSGSSFDQQGGALTVEATGGFTLDQGAFTISGGTVAAADPVRLQSSSLTIGPAVTSSPASFLLTGSCTLSGDVGASMVLDLLNGSIVASSDTRNGGRIDLRTSNQFSSASLSLPSGTLTNATTGTIDVLGPGGARTIAADLVNDGALGVAVSTSFSSGFDTINRGTWTVSSGTATFGADSLFRQEAGTLTLDGGLTIDQGTFVVAGGAIGGQSPVRIQSSGLVVEPAGVASPGTFLATGDSTLSGDIGPLMTVSIVDGDLVASSDSTNAGSIELSATNGFSGASLSALTGTITNGPTGVIDVLADGSGARSIAASVVNEGSLLVGLTTTFSGGFSYANRGTWTVNSGTATFGLDSTFRQEAGTLTLDGGVTIDQGTFVVAGGAIGGQSPVRIQGSGLVVEPSGVASPGTFFATGDSTLSGDIGPLMTVSIVDGDLRAVSDSTNTGRVELSATSGFSAASLSSQGGTITNAPAGVIEVLGSVGARSIAASLVNEGSLLVGLATTFSGGLSYTNRGSWTVTQGDSTFQSGTSFVQDAGALSFDGRWIMTQSAFSWQGGTITASGPLELGDSDLVLGAGSGSTPVVFQMSGPDGTLSGDIPAAIELSILDGTVAAPSTVSNSGILRLTATSFSSAGLLVSSGTLTNASGALMDIAPSGGATSVAASSLVNRGSLTMGQSWSLSGDLHNESGALFAGAGVLSFPVGSVRNSGVVLPGGAGAADVLTAGSDFEQTTSGRIGIDILASDQSDQLVISGELDIHGALDFIVDPSYSPQLGEVFDVIFYSSHQGVFAEITGDGLPNGLHLDVAYLADRIRVTVVP